MKTFIVFCEEYERFGGGQVDFELYEAADFEALCQILDPDYDASEDSEDDIVPLVDDFRGRNGDGCDFYIIKEILPDGTLSDDLMIEGC